MSYSSDPAPRTESRAKDRGAAFPGCATGVCGVAGAPTGRPICSLRVLDELLAAYGLPPAGAAAQRAPSGLIQETQLVRLADGRRFVLQRMHPMFGPAVLDDIEAVTSHLASVGLATPRLVRTPGGELGVHASDGRLWRLLTFLDGRTYDRVLRPMLAAEGAALVARFHRAVATFEHRFAFVRAGVHDTAAHLAKLERAMVPGDPVVDDVAHAILAEAARLPTLPDAPTRIAHGDLKISNLLFSDDERDLGVALLDLDTMGRLTIAYELGDALRSWCNPAGEDTPTTRLDLDVFRAAISGYAGASGGLLEAAEVAGIVPGFETVALELAARFCADAYEDRYFGWDPTHFPSRREHHRVRAAGQLRLAQLVGGARAELAAIVAAAFGRPH